MPIPFCEHDLLLHKSNEKFLWPADLLGSLILRRTVISRRKNWKKGDMTYLREDNVP